MMLFCVFRREFGAIMLEILNHGRFKSEIRHIACSLSLLFGGVIRFSGFPGGAHHHPSNQLLHYLVVAVTAIR